MTYTKADKRRYLILQCRYYKGEPEPPLTLPEDYRLIWGYEQLWVEWTLEGDPIIENFHEDIKHWNLETKEGDKTPLTLKALLCGRYLHWGSFCPLEEELKNFENWYVCHYQKWKTNREHRADKRRPELIAKCRYYHGEEECPNDCPKDIQIWNWEKDWVEALADSWLNRDKYQYDYVHLPEMETCYCKDLDVVRQRAKKLNVPFTLYLLLAINYAKSYQGPFKHEMEENFDHWIVEYSKHKS